MKGFLSILHAFAIFESYYELKGGGWYLTDVENSRFVYLFSYTEKNKLHWWVESILSVTQEGAYNPFKSYSWLVIS